jgi:uncharacterized protein (UPF0332 family)
VRPEASAFLDKARDFLLKAKDMLADDWPDEAGRAVYLAGLHAAQAVIVERTGKVIKRHRGVQNELRRLTNDDPRFDLELRAFLGRAYNFKAIADYETGPARAYRLSLPAPQSRQRVDLLRLLLRCLQSREPSGQSLPIPCEIAFASIAKTACGLSLRGRLSGTGRHSTNH